MVSFTLELVPQAHYLFDTEGRLHDGIEDLPFPGLDAFGNFDLAVAREQGNLAHFTQIHLYRISYAACRIRFKLEFVLLFLHDTIRVGDGTSHHLDLLFGIDYFDIHFIENHHHVIELLRCYDFFGKGLVDFVEREIAFLLARRDQPVKIVEFHFAQRRIAPLLGILFGHYLTPKRYRKNHQRWFWPQVFRFPQEGF